MTGGNTEGGPNQNPVNRLNTVTAFFGGGFRENLPAMTQFRSNHACGKYTTHSGTLVISTLFHSKSKWAKNLCVSVSGYKSSSRHVHFKIDHLCLLQVWRTLHSQLCHVIADLFQALVVVGGMGGDLPTDDRLLGTEELQLREDGSGRWRPGQELTPKGLINLRAVSIDDRIFVTGKKI